MPGGGRASANEFPEGKGVFGDGPDFFPPAAPAERASSSGGVPSAESSRSRPRLPHPPLVVRSAPQITV